MQVNILKSKIHRATITESDLNYIGSVTIDANLLEAANIIEYEKVLIVNNNNGARFETYVIKGEPDSGMICINGSAARLVQPGDIVIIMSFTTMEMEEAKTFHPAVIFPDKKNKI